MAKRCVLFCFALAVAGWCIFSPDGRAQDNDEKFEWLVICSETPEGTPYSSEKRANEAAMELKKLRGLDNEFLYHNVHVIKVKLGAGPLQPSRVKKGNNDDEPTVAPAGPRPSGKGKIVIQVREIVDGIAQERPDLAFETSSDYDGASKYYWEMKKKGYLLTWQGTVGWATPKVLGETVKSADPGAPYKAPSNINVQPGKKSGSDGAAVKRDHWVTGTSWGGYLSWSKDGKDWRGSNALVVTFTPDGKGYTLIGHENKQPDRSATTWRADGKNVILSKLYGTWDVVLPMPDPKVKESYSQVWYNGATQMRLELRKDWGLKRKLYRGVGPGYDWVPSTNDSDYTRADR